MSAAEAGANPHLMRGPAPPRAGILASALDAIGNTPCIRINSITADEGVECELVAKCEFFNAGGSVKDRIGKRMLEDAERAGRIKPGDTLIEPTSGNTGIGIALAAALKGYRCIITLPEKMSQEKVDVLKALGAEIIRTPTEAAFDAPESHIGVARRLNRELPNSHILDQYGNPSNPLAHYEGTALEIWEQCGGKVDMVVMTAGTGGTLTGVARRLRELNPAVIIVGVDPKGSILAQPDALNDECRLQSYAVEGIGYDFVPAVLDRALVDRWVKTDDRESLVMSRRLIRQEGLLCGGSSGAAMAGAIKAIKAAGLGKGKRAVVLLADGVRNYMTKFLSDDYMWRQGFSDATRAIGVSDGAVEKMAWAHKTVADLGVASPITVLNSVTAAQAAELMSRQGVDQLPVVDGENNIVGVVSDGHLSSKLASGRIKASDPVGKALFSQFRKVSVSTPLSDLARAFERDAFAVVVQSQRVFSGDKSPLEKVVVVGVVTRIDLIRFMTSSAPAPSPTATGV
jgi:cystathionine beta-synthase